MKKKDSYIVSFVVALSVWILLTGTLELPSFIAGALVSLLVMFSTAQFFSAPVKKFLEPQRYLYFIKFALVFLWECVLANFDVAFRVMQPEMPINPGIVKVKTKLKTEVALTALANSITLTPGTFTVDIEPKEGLLYIHWINVQDENIVKATEIIVKKFEGLISKVFE